MLLWLLIPLIGCSRKKPESHYDCCFCSLCLERSGQLLLNPLQC
jgi:hypothetical protein